jgi:ribA/ribD-fused uncharacterized protein
VAKRIARANSDKRPPDWDSQKIPAMTEILRAKLSQHAEVRDILKATGDALIEEDSVEDAFWGRGADGKGENNLGRIWMELRSGL